MKYNSDDAIEILISKGLITNEDFDKIVTKKKEKYELEVQKEKAEAVKIYNEAKKAQKRENFFFGVFIFGIMMMLGSLLGFLGIYSSSVATILYLLGAFIMVLGLNKMVLSSKYRQSINFVENGEWYD